MNKTIEEKIVKGLIAFWLVTIVAFTLSSCSSTYNCPAYGSNYNVNTNANG
jgi:hypothetical protein